MKKFLVYDTGLATEHAVRLAKDGHKVKYFTPWNSNYPTFLDHAIGLGLEGIEKELHFFPYLDWADCICFFDTGMGDLATFLRGKGYRVFGAGFKGEQLENHRYYSRWVQKSIGLPTQETTRIRGTEQLKKFLAEHDDVVVKHDIFRGDLETLFSKDKAHTEQAIRDIAAKVGPFSEQLMFLAEEAIDGIEPGFDLWHNGKGWLKPFFYGYEYKSGYIGKVSDTLPKPLALVAERIGDYLTKIDYRCAFSSEAIITKEGVPYMIDFTSRMPFPLSLIYTELIDNFSEVVYKVAGGEDVEIKMRAKYAGITPLFSDWAKEHWLTMNVNPEDRYCVKFQGVAKADGLYHAVPRFSMVASLVALGDSVEEVHGRMKEYTNKISAHDLDAKSVMGSLDVIKETIAEGKKSGIPF